MEVFLRTLLKRVLPTGCTVRIHTFRGKRDLLKNIDNRLRGYRHWLPPDARIIIVVDRDGDDCHQLKEQLENVATQSGLESRTQAGNDSWQVVNRIAIEELEAWYFGDWSAVRCAYPRVPVNIPRKAHYRNPDAIKGGTWEAFERVLKRRGYFETGLRKVEAAYDIAHHIDPTRNSSRSFARFYDAIVEATS